MADGFSRLPRYESPRPEFPDWGAGNLIDPTGFLRTVSSGGNPFQRDPYGGEIQPRGAGTDPSGMALPSEAEINNFIATLEASGLPDTEIQRLYLRVKERPWTLDSAYQELEQSRINVENQGLAREQQEKLEGFRRAGQSQIDQYEQAIAPQLEGEINQFTRGTGGLDSEFIFRDPSYSGEMSVADAAINANIDREREALSTANAASGVASSGRTTAMARDTERSGAFDKARVRSDLYSRARGELSDARERYRGFRRDLATERNNVNAGYAPQYGYLSQYERRTPVDRRGIRDTEYDEYYGREGLDMARTGQLIDAGTAIAGTASNLAGTFSRTVRPGG